MSRQRCVNISNHGRMTDYKVICASNKCRCTIVRWVLSSAVLISTTSSIQRRRRLSSAHGVHAPPGARRVVATVVVTALVGLKDFLRPITYRLMRKQLSALALQVVERQRQLSVAVTRIQYGFMPRENTLEASKHLREINAMLREIEASLEPAFDQVKQKA